MAVWRPRTTAIDLWTTVRLPLTRPSQPPEDDAARRHGRLRGAAEDQDVTRLSGGHVETAGSRSSACATSRTPEHRWVRAAGETLVEVSERLGHSQLAITADTYTHVLPVVALASSATHAALIPCTANGAQLVPGPGLASGDVPTWCPPRAADASSDAPPRAFLQVDGLERRLPRLDLNQKPCD